MGCCQSKLLGIEDPEMKYQPGPSPVNYGPDMPKGQLLKISPIVNDNGSSLCTIRSGLSRACKNFEADKGPITTTFIENVDKNGNKTIKIAENYECKQNSFAINTEMATQSNIGSQQNQESVIQQNNDKILSINSLQTKRQLEKQLFYINSNQIGPVKLMKWTEENRVPFYVSKQQIAKNFVDDNTYFGGALYMVCLYQEIHKVSLFLYKKVQKQITNVFKFRVFLNGIKRMLSVYIPSGQENVIAIASQIPKTLSFLKECLSFWVFLLTGWIPQIINLANSTETKQLLIRLIKNFNNGNLIVGFTSEDQREMILVRRIFLQTQLMDVAHIGVNGWRDRQLSWQEVTDKYSTVHVNWNPFIYTFSKKIQGTCELKNNKRTTPKFLLKIPSSKSEVQVRIHVQVHQTQLNHIKSFQLYLYESNGCYLNFQQKNTPIRKSLSIFMFEQCEEPTQYIIALQFLENAEKEHLQQIQVTIDLYSFCQIGAEFIQEPWLLASTEIQSKIEPKHAGFGMNSPFFNNNLQYSLLTPLGSICKLSIRPETQKPIIFQIYVVPDQHNCQDLTLIKPEQLVKDAIQSQQFCGEAQFQLKPKAERSIVVIVCFTPTHGIVHFGIQSYSVKSDFLPDAQNCLSVSQTQYHPQFWRQLTFKWQEASPGPRKRTLANSQSKWYPISTFSKFLTNPYIDYYLPAGVYQFSASSLTFSQSLTQQDIEHNELECDRILNASPPSLSMGIFMLSEGKEEAKIIVDDYQYVPYGIGFWTHKMRVEGLYRFVFSKMEKVEEEGIFRIRKF